MNSKREKEQDEHRETVVTGQIEKRSASTAHHTSVLPGDRGSPIPPSISTDPRTPTILRPSATRPVPFSISTDHHTNIIIGRPQEIEKSEGNRSGDISDDNNIIQSSDKAHDEKSEQ